jgi:hypothetical protein
MKLDTMTMTILDDGTIKTVTSDMSGANHSSADDLIKSVEKLAGGVAKVAKRGDHRHGHGHHHDHVHQHNKK